MTPQIDSGLKAPRLNLISRLATRLVNLKTKYPYGDLFENKDILKFPNIYLISVSFYSM